MTFRIKQFVPTTRKTSAHARVLEKNGGHPMPNSKQKHGYLNI
jgi:hypothetical protein